MMLTVDIQLPRDRFTLSVNETLSGESIWAIMGRSGCGKTSLLRTIAGLEDGAQGQILFGNEVWQDTGRKIWVPPEQRSIGYIFQEARLFPHLDVMGNLQFSRRRANVGNNAPSLPEVVEQLEIEHLLNRSVDRLSGGEKQRVAIARTLLNAPRLLLMDEPLASLDWASKTRILPCLRNIHRHFGIPVIMVSHAREEVARLADKLLLVERGQILERGDCRQLFSRPGSTLTSDDCALSILEVKVAHHDDRHGLTELLFGGQSLLVNQIAAVVGSKLRVILPAQEVSIVLKDIRCTSIQNRVSGKVTAIHELGSNNVMLALEAEGQALLALITRRSLELLDLSIGQRIFAHFKASCLDVI